MQRIIGLLLVMVIVLSLSYSPAHAEAHLNYLVLVNLIHTLPDDWETMLETVKLTNSVGDEVEVEKKAWEAYVKLKEDLEKNDGIYVELDSALRSIAEQQEIMDRFTEKYGADYAAKTAAVPGYSEHHTGLALDFYFRIRQEDGTFQDVYYNEDMTLPEYEGLWATIHGKLADYGFILRYPKDKEYITGYSYEPWHIRYIDDVEKAKEIMTQPGMTLEVLLGAATDADVTVDFGTSELYTREDLEEAALQAKCKFATFEGCELHALSYAGDGYNTEENLARLNDLDEGKDYTQVAMFVSSFHSPLHPDEASEWKADTEYTDYRWWLARTADGGWQLLTWGFD